MALGGYISRAHTKPGLQLDARAVLAGRAAICIFLDVVARPGFDNANDARTRPRIASRVTPPAVHARFAVFGTALQHPSLQDRQHWMRCLCGRPAVPAPSTARRPPARCGNVGADARQGTEAVLLAAQDVVAVLMSSPIMKPAASCLKVAM
ncbi:MAG: hypothetical protein EON56_00020 [Alphaproteobacteria bacterium]|nr:MAG: hypothetical protein EON56_00020 [Alphaproteobacteria bacterium]